MGKVHDRFTQLKETEYQEAILFLRIGDWLETFDDDAETVSKELGVMLIERKGVKMAGWPVAKTSELVNALFKKRTIVILSEGGLFNGRRENFETAEGSGAQDTGEVSELHGQAGPES